MSKEKNATKVVSSKETDVLNMLDAISTKQVSERASSSNSKKSIWVAKVSTNSEDAKKERQKLRKQLVRLSIAILQAKQAKDVTKLKETILLFKQFCKINFGLSDANFANLNVRNIYAGAEQNNDFAFYTDVCKVVSFVETEIK